MRKMKPQYRMIGEVRQPNGDSGHVFFMASLDGAVNLKDIGEVARAEAKWCKDENSTAQHARFCDMLVADFATPTGGCGMTNNIVNLDDHRPHVTAYVACIDAEKIGSLRTCRHPAL
jgi:hypothetical protein